jgi:integrase
MPRITKRSIDVLLSKPTDRDLFRWDSGDGSLKGFGIRVKKSGVASFIVQYRNQEGRTRRLVLGRVGEMTPDEARQLAADKLAEVRKGRDPSAERHTVRDAILISELCSRYIENARGRIKDTTLAADQSRIRTHVMPLLGRRSVAGLTRPDIEKFQADIAAGKSAKPRKESGRGGQATGGRGVAARTVGMLSTILQFAKKQGVISENPARGVEKFADNKLRRFLSIEELAALGAAMREAEGAGENKTGIEAIRALLLTGCRRNEILALPWAWLDAKARCIRFDDTKSGPQIRPIGTTAANFLASQARQGACPWIFPADRHGEHFVGLPRVLDRLCARAKIKRVTVHTLRHSFAATAAGLGFSELTIAGLLGHQMPGITARYAHMPDGALLVAADRVSARIAGALDGCAEAEIVALPALRSA